MSRIEQINSYYEKNFAELEKIHQVLNNATNSNVNMDNYKILGWESRQAQYARFAAFAKNVELEKKSLLDVGCGLGDLYHFLTTGLNKNIEYVGIDIIEKMIETAKNQLELLIKSGWHLPSGNCSSAKFFVANIFDDNFFTDSKFDYVYSSGIFNLNLGNNEQFVKNAFLRFLKFCKNGFCCSMLNVRSTDKEEPYFYYDANVVKKWAIDCGCKDVKIVDDYLENDFTIVATV